MSESSPLELRLRADLAEAADAADPAPPSLPTVVASARRQDRRARFRYVAAVAALVLAVAGVAAAGLRSSSDDDPIDTPASVEESGIPVLDGAYREEGPLADGLVVPAGTALLGDVFHRPATLTDEFRVALEGWDAHLLVVGDLDDVMADLEVQADELSLRAELTDGCGGGEPQPAGRIACGAAWRGDEFVLSAVLVRGEIRGTPVSILDLSTSPVVGEGEASSTFDPPDEPLPTGWSDPPGPGDPLAAEAATAELQPLRVPEGAHAVIVPWAWFDEGYTAVLAVDGDLDAVLDDFEQQLDALDIGPVTRESYEAGGADGVVLYAHQAGGRDYSFIANTTNGRSWISLRTSMG